MALALSGGASAQVVSLSDPSAPGQAASTASAQSGSVQRVDPIGGELSPDVPAVRVRVEAASPSYVLEQEVGHDLQSGLIPTYSSQGVMSLRSITIAVPVFRPLCTGDCLLDLGVGLTYRFSVDPADGRRGMYRGRTRSVQITERTTGLFIDFQDRRKHRRRRWIAVAALPVLGGLMMGLAPSLDRRFCERHPDSCAEYGRNDGLFWSGVVLACTPVLSYMLPLFTRDRSYVEVIEQPEP